MIDEVRRAFGHALPSTTRAEPQAHAASPNGASRPAVEGMVPFDIVAGLMFARARALGRHAWWWTAVLGGEIGRRLAGRPRLAPGGFGASAIPRFGTDRSLLDRARRHGPVFKVLWSRKLTTCVVGLDRGRRLLGGHSNALVPRALEIDALVPRGFLRRMAGVDHRTYRAGFLDAFRGDLPAIWDAELRALLRAELTALSRAHARGAATPAQLATTLDRAAVRLLLIVVTGQQPGTPMFDRIETEFAGIQSWNYPRSRAQEETYRQLRDTMSSLASKMVSSPAEERTSVLRNLVRGSLGPELDDTTIGNLIFMTDTGRHDVRGLFRWILKYLSDHPDVVASLRRPGTTQGAVTPPEACVLETLRLDQAESQNRDVVRGFEFEGCWVPAGSALRILLRESHRDSNAFPNPDAFRPSRFIEHQYGSDVYAPFGIGEHRCVASSLVVRLGTLLVEELTKGFEWTVESDGPRHRGRYHWEPSPAFAIRLRPRD